MRQSLRVSDKQHDKIKKRAAALRDNLRKRKPVAKQVKNKKRTTRDTSVKTT
jgi:hypothetical protein